MTTHHIKLSFVGQKWAGLLAYLALFMLLFAPQASHAQSYSQCSKEVAGCVVNTAKSAYYAVSAVGGAVEFAALHANCVADVASGNPITIGVTSAIVGVAGSGAISSVSYDSCKSSLYGAAARPLASALVEIIPHEKLKSFAYGEGVALASDGFEAIASAIPIPISPGAPTLAAQLSCGCAVAAAGAGLIDNLKHMLIATAAAADQCTGAMGCLSAATLNAIADVGKATGKVTVAVAKCAWTPNDCGEKEAIPPEQYWTYNFAPFVPIYADLLVTNANTYCGTNSIYEYKTCSPAQELENKRNECLSYHTAHKASADTARAICNPMRDRVLKESQVIVNRRMADEIFPKKALEYAKATFPLEGANRYASGDFAFCNAPKDVNKPTGIDLTGASYYTMSSQSAKITNDCIDALLRSIGIDRGNRLVLNTNNSGVVLLAEAKAAAQKNNWNFNDTFTTAYAKWESRRNSIKNTYQDAVIKAAKEDSVFIALNAVYAKSARDVYVAGIANCPKAGAVGHLDCIKDMRSYMGMRSAFTAQNPAEGYIDFSAWGSTPPKPYVSAMSLLEKVKAQNGNVFEATSGAVAWAMQDAAKILATFPAKSVAEENSALKLERTRQNAQVAKVQSQLDDNYASAKNRCKQSSCAPKIDAIRQEERLDESNLLKKLIAATGPSITLRGLDAYLEDMKALEVVTRPKYKSVLDLEMLVVGADSQKRVGVGLALTNTEAGSAKPLTEAGKSPPIPSSRLEVGITHNAAVQQAKTPNPPAQAALPAPSSGAVKQGGAIGMPSAPGMAAMALKDNKPPQNAGFLAAIEPAKTAPPAASAQQNNKPADAVIVAITPKEAAPLVTPPPPPPPPSPQTPKAGGIAAAAGASNNPVSNPNNNPNSAAAAAAAAEKLVPFDEPGYRQERANVLYPLWLTKCNNNSHCLQAMAPILVKRIDVEASAVRSGKPDHKDKPAVAKLQASLNPIYDPQLEAVIPKIATSTPVTGGNVSSQIPKNLKPGAGFKP
jgi:hypothetical protein